MLTSLNIESLVRSILDMSTVVAEDYREYLPVRTHALAWATGMTDKEVLDYLDLKGIVYFEDRTSYDAVKLLKNWYLKKMRRYVRNSLAQGLEPGSLDDILFHQFCEEYRKHGHTKVKSWDDIDEYRLLFDFETKCLSFSDCPFFVTEARETYSLLGRIHRSFLFHLRFNRIPKHNPYRVKSILSIILCNRYHIFTAEADSNVDTTDYKGINPDIFKFNPPRSASRHVFAS